MSLEISVIIPVWNDAERIKLCLDALYEQSLGREKFEVIVVDNASTDGTKEVLTSYPWVKTLYEPQAGSYVARNRALNSAKGEYLAFTDSDCIPADNWLESCLESAQAHPNFGVIAGDVRFFQPSGLVIEQSAIDFENMFSMDQKINSQNGVSITANFFVKRETVANFGGFNASLKSGGDHELSRRIHNSHLPVIYCEDGPVYHPARNISELLIKRKRVIGGTWDENKGKNKLFLFIWRATKLFIKRQLLVVVAGEIPLKRKALLLGLLIRIYSVSISEILRLSSGGISSRS